MKIATSLVFASLLAMTGVARADWTAHAIRLTGESERVRDNAIKALKTIPDLDAQLRKALKTPQKYLALDAITALGRQSWTQDLTHESLTDETGAVYLALNTLINSDNKKQITQIYLERLLAKPYPSLPARMILIDTLGRTQTEIPRPVVMGWLNDPAFEVRDAALYYSRLRLKANADPQWLSVIEKSLTSAPYQLRLRALFTLKDLPSRFKEKATQLLNLCKQDTNKEVLANCEKLKREGL